MSATNKRLADTNGGRLLIEKARPDLVESARAIEDLGLGDAPGIDILADDWAGKWRLQVISL